MYVQHARPRRQQSNPREVKERKALAGCGRGRQFMLDKVVSMEAEGRRKWGRARSLHDRTWGSREGWREG
jgi:hypothetical protein